jgi:hypothetical protein
MEPSTVVAAAAGSKAPSTETNSSDRNTDYSTKSKTRASLPNAGTAADASAASAAASAAADVGGVSEAREDSAAAAAAADAAATTAQTTVAAAAPGNDSSTVTNNDAKAATDTATGTASASHKTPCKQSTAKNGSSAVTPDQNTPDPVTFQYSHARYSCGGFTEDIINNANLLSLTVMVTKNEETGEMVFLPANQTDLDHQKVVDIQSTFADHHPNGPMIISESSLAVFVCEKRDQAEVNQVRFELRRN